MKKILLVFTFLGLMTFEAFAQNVTADSTETTLIFVRHAEKADDDPRDPILSEQGEQRAVRLKDILMEEFSLGAIYSTPYKRTRLTGMPVANELDIHIQEYGFSDPESTVRDWINDYKGQVVLILGHSNTTPFFVNLIVGEEQYEQLDEKEYGKLFIVEASEVGKASVEIRNY